MTNDERFVKIGSTYGLTVNHIDDVDAQGDITFIYFGQGLPSCSSGRPTAAQTGRARALQKLLTRLREQFSEYQGTGESLAKEFWTICHIPAVLNVSKDLPYVATITCGNTVVYSDSTPNKTREALREIICKAAVRDVARFIGDGYIPINVNGDILNLYDFLKTDNDTLKFSLRKGKIIADLSSGNNNKVSVSSTNPAVPHFFKILYRNLRKNK